MFDPSVADVSWHLLFSEDGVEQTKSTIEVTTADGVGTVSGLQGATFVLARATEVRARELELEILESALVDLLEEVADHHVRGDAVDERVDDAAQLSLTEFFEMGRHVGESSISTRDGKTF